MVTGVAIAAELLVRPRPPASLVPAGIRRTRPARRIRPVHTVPTV